MARKDKYGKNKAKVSPLMLTIAGLFFISMILIIVFSMDTKKQKFDKQYNLTENNYKLSTFKKVNKEIEDGKKVIVIFDMAAEESNTGEILTAFNDAYRKQGAYENYQPETNKVNEHVDVIYYVFIKDVSELSDFMETHKDISTTGIPLALSFNNKELQTQYKDVKNSGELESPETKLIVRNTAQFFTNTTEAFSK